MALFDAGKPRRACPVLTGWARIFNRNIRSVSFSRGHDLAFDIFPNRSHYFHVLIGGVRRTKYLLRRSEMDIM
ncbi:MAG TPA: hypothetical protein VEK32_10395 [Thermodesulfobacteriota bacterium]|nr:hypothetical protein [Thermodesulfobacteriota bacterium]